MKTIAGTIVVALGLAGCTSIDLAVEIADAIAGPTPPAWVPHDGTFFDIDTRAVDNPHRPPRRCRIVPLPNLPASDTNGWTRAYADAVRRCVEVYGALPAAPIVQEAGR